MNEDKEILSNLKPEVIDLYSNTETARGKHKMTKDEILQQIADVFVQQNNNTRQNPVGVRERMYNEFYLTGSCFTLNELHGMSESELNNLIKLADYAAQSLV